MKLWLYKTWCIPLCSPQWPRHWRHQVWGHGMWSFPRSPCPLKSTSPDRIPQCCCLCGDMKLFWCYSITEWTKLKEIMPKFFIMFMLITFLSSENSANVWFLLTLRCCCLLILVAGNSYILLDSTYYIVKSYVDLIKLSLENIKWWCFLPLWNSLCSALQLHK